MSTELPDFRKLNVQPETDEELRARFNSNTNTNETDQDTNNAAGDKDANYKEQLTQEQKGKQTRAQQMRKFGFILGGTLGVGALAMGSANLLGNSSDEKEATIAPESTASAGIVPGANETTTPTVDTTPSPYASPTNTEFLNTAKPVIDTQPSDVIESGLFEGLSPEQQTEIKSLDSMSVEQFRDQPLEKQLVFAQFAYDNNAPRILKNMRDYGFEYEAYANRVTEPAETNTAQQVVDSASMVIDVAGNLYNDKNEYDLDTARKMLALGVEETSAAYDGYDSYLQTREIGLTMTTSTDISASKTFETEKGPLMKINYAKDEKFGQTSYQFVTFKDIAGTDRGAWKWLLSVPQTDGRFDSTVQ